MTNYIKDEFKNSKITPIFAPLDLPTTMWGQIGRPGAGVGGYGKNIKTDYMLKIDNRTYRVFCTQISNNQSLWIKTYGRYRTGKYYISEELDSLHIDG